MRDLLKIINNTDFEDESALNESFICFDVSYFDHYLSSDEYEKEKVVCFSDVGQDHEKNKLFEEIQSKFLKLYVSLYSLSDNMVSVVIEGKIFDKISFEEYRSYLNSSMRENPLCNFYFHNLKLYIATGYDLTHRFFLEKENVTIFKPLLKLINKSGLYVLLNKE